MKFRSINGKEHKIDIKQSQYPLKDIEHCKSNFQWRVGCILRSSFPQHVILEEFTIPGSRLSLDFFLPQIKVGVEVDGEQHFTFNSFFHNTMADFKKSLENDRLKEQWCELNNIYLIRIRRGQDVASEIREGLSREREN